MALPSASEIALADIVEVFQWVLLLLSAAKRVCERLSGVQLERGESGGESVDGQIEWGAPVAFSPLQQWQESWGLGGFFVDRLSSCCETAPLALLAVGGVL